MTELAFARGVQPTGELSARYPSFPALGERQCWSLPPLPCAKAAQDREIFSLLENMHLSVPKNSHFLLISLLEPFLLAVSCQPTEVPC